MPVHPLITAVAYWITGRTGQSTAKRLLVAAAASTAFALLKEAGDQAGWWYGRFSWLDLGADAAGTASSLVLINLHRSVLRRDRAGSVGVV
ncbi:hypothetical protein WJX73_008641 [Symbiochloris irregularis]|uniref:VanZ-like domain-containing protein n=1 Tax=Symbiochloris irregularis TaxID=706552 RepID=A0AAW1PZS1_9CHLO